MDKLEAKLILSSCTLENEPVYDPRFAAALALAEQDQELAQWWTSQKQADLKLRDALQHFPVPDDLHSALNMTLAEQGRKHLRFEKARKWFSIAALFLLGFFAYFEYGIDRSDDYTGPLAQSALDYARDGPRLSYFSRESRNLQDWLTEYGFNLPDQLPPKLLALEGVGCRALDWSTEKVALMCFNADTVYHLFIGMKRDFPDSDVSEQIEYAQNDGGWTVSEWRDQDHIFILTAKTTLDEMSQLLANYTPGADPAAALQ